MMNFTTLAVDDRDDRVTVRLNRPDKRNAIDQAMVDELHTVCGELERRPRPMLLTGGADGVFAAGADIGQLRDRTSADALRAINSGLFNRIRALPMPTIAAIDGPALGGGAELSYACDIRLCTTRSFFGQPEARLGIIAGAGATWRLPALVGESLAKELLFTGRRMAADEALRAGLVSDVVEPEALLDRADALLTDIGKAAPMALRLTKLAVNSGSDAHPHVELAAQALLFDSEEKHDRMTKFLNR